MSWQKNSYGRSGSVITLAVFATLLLIASTASASSDTVQNAPGQLYNPCQPNPENVNYTGQLHTVSNNQTTTSGMHVNMLMQQNGKGTGVVTLAQYNVGTQFKINMNVPPGSFLMRTWEKATPTGSTLASNFWLLSKTYLHPDGSDGGTSFDFHCQPEQP